MANLGESRQAGKSVHLCSPLHVQSFNTASAIKSPSLLRQDELLCPDPENVEKIFRDLESNECPKPPTAKCPVEASCSADASSYLKMSPATPNLRDVFPIQDPGYGSLDQVSSPDITMMMANLDARPHGSSLRRLRKDRPARVQQMAELGVVVKPRKLHSKMINRSSLSPSSSSPRRWKRIDMQMHASSLACSLSGSETTDGLRMQLSYNTPISQEQNS